MLYRQILTENEEKFSGNRFLALRANGIGEGRDEICDSDRTFLTGKRVFFFLMVFILFHKCHLTKNPIGETLEL